MIPASVHQPGFVSRIDGGSRYLNDGDEVEICWDLHQLFKLRPPHDFVKQAPPFPPSRFASICHNSSIFAILNPS
jgi:hypothetical protein